MCSSALAVNFFSNWNLEWKFESQPLSCEEDLRGTGKFLMIGIIISIKVADSKELDRLISNICLVQMIKIDPLNPETVWAATTEGTYRTQDAGKTWVKMHDVIMATDIEIRSMNTQADFDRIVSHS